MKLATVVGTVVSTISHPFFDEKRLLLCDLHDAAHYRDTETEADPDADPGPATAYTIAVNAVDAGVGDRVLLLDEGTGARQVFDVPTGPIRTVVVGIVDQVHED